MSRNKRWFEIISKPLNKKAKKHLNETILPGLCPLYYYYLHNELLEEGFSLLRQVDGKNPFLHLNERCIKIQKHVYFEGNREFARE